ncbi:MAG: hypothetical protein A2Y25_03185 [Candidatus Melainabacteria bacterium GWF2_37_15]|nr:MAG: hypothetical protein A2Y25_03185 [Candidatus Melainabacteria bacterium GWF2_37_15]
MKKIIILSALLIAASVFSTKCFAESAWGDLQQAADDGDSAVNSYSDGSYDYEDASTNAGYGFDTSSDSAPAVDLTGAGEHPTPQLLRDSDDY